MLAYQQKESTARVASIMENTNLSKQQQVSEIMRQMLTQAQTAGQYFTNDQIKEMTRKVSAEVDLVHQQTQNQRYGSSHIGATAKDISNVVTDAASGVVDLFHGMDKAVDDTGNNFSKDGKPDVFFFQAEDGIRDYKVTGVQTCALPILAAPILLGEEEAYIEQQAAIVYRDRLTREADAGAFRQIQRQKFSRLRPLVRRLRRRDRKSVG